MNQLNLTFENIIKRISKAQAWEIRDPLFNQVIADSSNFSDINEAIEEIRNDYQGQPIIIKAGNRDKNGNVANNSKNFQFTLPRLNETNTVIQLNPQTQNSDTFIYNGMNGVTQQINPQNLASALGEVEKRLTEKFDVQLQKTALELEYSYKLNDLERREREIKRKEIEIARQKKEYEDKLNRTVPKVKDFATKVLDGLLFGDEKQTSPETATKELKGTNKTFDFKINETNETNEPENTEKNIDDIFENLSDEEKEKFLNKYVEFEDETNEPEPETNEPENTEKEIKI